MPFGPRVLSSAIRGFLLLPPPQRALFPGLFAVDRRRGSRSFLRAASLPATRPRDPGHAILDERGRLPRVQERRSARSPRTQRTYGMYKLFFFLLRRRRRRRKRRGARASGCSPSAAGATIGDSRANLAKSYAEIKQGETEGWLVFLSVVLSLVPLVPFRFSANVPADRPAGLCRRSVLG